MKLRSKKLLALLLAGTMVLTPAVSAYAEEEVPVTAAETEVVETVETDDAEDVGQMEADVEAEADIEAETVVEIPEEASVEEEAPEEVLSETQPEETEVIDVANAEGEEERNTESSSVTKIETLDNKTSMFKAVSASYEVIDGQAYLRMALSGTSYHYLFKGTYEEAAANGDNSANWITYYENADGKYEFLIPLTEAEVSGSQINITSISNTYYTKYQDGENAFERALFPRKAILDLENKTLTTDDYSEVTTYTATSNYKMQKVDANAVYSVVGGPNSNNYAQTITLTNTSAYDKAYVGTVKTTKDEIAEEDAIAFTEDGAFTISVKDIADGEPIPVAFHSTKSGSWFNRTITIDRSAKTVLLDNVLADYTAVNEAKASVPEDLTYYTEESAQAVQDALDAVNTSKNSAEQDAVDAMAQAINEAVAGLEKAYAELELTSSLGMFHFDNPVQVVIKGETATVTIHSVTGSSRYDQMALGTYDEIIADPSKAIIGVVDEGNAEDGTNAYYFTFDIPVSQLAEGTTINYVLRYREGYSDTHDGDWYQGKSGDYYLTVGSLTLPHKLTETPADEPTCTTAGNTDYWTCSTCGRYFSDAFAGKEITEDDWTIPALGHDYQEISRTVPTPGTQGSSTKKCSRCGDVKTDVIVAAEVTARSSASGLYLKGLESAIVASDLAESLGYTDQIDSTQNVSVLDVLVAEHMAIFEECTEDYLVSDASGYVSKIFGVSTYANGFMVNEGYPNDGTESSWGGYNGTTVNTTVAADGDVIDFYTYIDDSYYSDYYGFVELPDMVSVGSEVTATVTGTMAMAGYLYKTPEDFKAAAEALEDASLAYVDITTGQTTPIADVVTDEDGKATFTAPTEAGTYYLTAVGDEDQPIIMNPVKLEVHVHDLQAVAAVEPTCTQDGNTAYWTCSVCGKYFADENGETEITEEDWTIPALGHAWDAGKVTKKASSTAKTAGSVLYTCTRENCNEAKVEAIAYPKAATLEFTAAVYTGSAYKPTVTVKDSSGNVIKASGNYTVKYTNNTKVGKATVTITFTGDKYTGTLTKTFMIRANTTKVSSLKSTAKGVKVTWKKVAGAAGYYVYRKGTSGAIATIKSGTTVSYVDTKAKTNGKAYKYRVKPYFDKTTVKNYSKTSVSAYKLTYYVARTAIKSVTNSASKTMTVKWKKNAKATGYQVKYVVGSTTKTVTVKGKASLSKVIKSLKKGKTYKVYVRAYKTVKGSNYFSAWSAVKSVKIKK